MAPIKEHSLFEGNKDSATVGPYSFINYDIAKQLHLDWALQNMSNLSIANSIVRLLLLTHHIIVLHRHSNHLDYPTH